MARRVRRQEKRKQKQARGRRQEARGEGGEGGGEWKKRRKKSPTVAKTLIGRNRHFEIFSPIIPNPKSPIRTKFFPYIFHYILHSTPFYHNPHRVQMSF